MEVKLGKQMVDDGPAATDSDLTNLNRILVIALHLACLLTRDTPDPNSDDYVELHRAIYELVQINAKDKGVSLSHFFSLPYSLWGKLFYLNNIFNVVLGKGRTANDSQC